MNSNKTQNLKCSVRNLKKGLTFSAKGQIISILGFADLTDRLQGLSSAMVAQKHL